MFDHEGNPALSHQEIYKANETDERVPSTYRECVEMHVCPYCALDKILTHVPEIDAPRTEGFCSTKHHQRWIQESSLPESYQMVKANIEHDHRLLAEEFGDDYYRLVRQAPERESLTVEELRKELENIGSVTEGDQNDISEAA